MSLAGRFDVNVTDATVHQVAAECNILGVVWHNDDSAMRFLQIFNVASGSVTLGTTTPDMVLQLNADSSDSFPLFGAKFSAACSIAVTTTATGNTAGTSSWVLVAFT